MDERLIDDIARRAATGMPRRRLLGAFAAGAAGLLAERREAAASCKNVGQHCDKDNDCCHGAKCKGKHCACKGSRTACDGACVDLDADEAHCGRCDKTCADTQTCCGGACVTLATNERFCGACDVSCAATEECVDGVCVTPPGGCAPGADSCAAGQNIPCGAGSCCVCSQSTDGATVCGVVAAGQCGECQTRADCAALGPDALCVATGSVHCCGPDRQNVCRLPCPA